MLQTTTSSTDVEPGCDEVEENVSTAASTNTTSGAPPPPPGRRRYVASNLKTTSKTPSAPGTTTTHQLSVNFDLSSPVADSDVRPSAGDQQGRCSRFNRRTAAALTGAGRNKQYHMQPRRSLLGKPINYRAHRRDVKYRRLQNKIYNFLERPKDYPSVSYHLIV